MALQTTYGRELSSASAGTIGSDHGHKASYLNDEGSPIAAGIAVAYKSEGKCELIDAGTDEIAGIVLNYDQQDRDDLEDDEYAPDGASITLLEEGDVYVQCEQTVTPADPVYVRHTVTTTEKLGAFRKDSDSGKARLVPGARFLTAGSTTVAPKIWFSKQAEKSVREANAAQYQVTLSAAAEAANAIVVTGAVKDLNGNAVTSAKQVMVRTLAVTADKGDISVTTGTAKEIVNPATGENVAWIETTAAGAFVVSIANDQAEGTIVQALTESGQSALLALTFA
jgi:hypothetical protein